MNRLQKLIHSHTLPSSLGRISMLFSLLNDCQRHIHSVNSQKPLSAGFEPARAEPNRFLVYRLNHSATTTVDKSGRGMGNHVQQT